MSDGSRTEIFICEEDVPQEAKHPGKRGRERNFSSPIVSYNVLLPADWVKQIDMGTRIGVPRPVVVRAIFRHVLENKPEIVTGWARQKLYE